jgi:sporulation protein YlmC with PRC-barrel domain
MNKIALGCLTALLLTAPVMAQTSAPVQSLSNSQIGGLWRASKLDGVNIYNNNNDKIGAIDDVLIDHTGKSMAVAVDVGGFLGMGTHRVALRFEDVKFSDLPRNASSSTNASDKPAAAISASTAAQAAPAAPVSSNSTTGAAIRTTNNMYPDHAILNMTKDQLKALPQVSYTR